MSRPLWSLRPFLWQAIALLAMFLLLGFFSLPILFWPEPLLIGLALSPLWMLAVFGAAIWRWRNRWLWAFCRRVRRFATVKSTGIILHYEPELERGWNLSTLLQSCQNELDDLTGLFGFPLRRRVKVYLFAHWRDISTVFGPQYGGLAISEANAIVIANDDRLPEAMRHELVHLFSFRWNVNAPPLLSEGLAVYLQGMVWGQRIDAVAHSLLRRGSPRLSSLLRSEFFFAEPQRLACYTLAGSFTGFLIRRYGWECYRKLYRLRDGTRFSAKFQKCFGVSLEKAEWQWRNELLVMPILNRRLGRKPYC